MRTLDMRRLLPTWLLVATLALAGCLEDGDGKEEDDTALDVDDAEDDPDERDSGHTSDRTRGGQVAEPVEQQGDPAG